MSTPPKKALAPVRSLLPNAGWDAIKKVFNLMGGAAMLTGILSGFLHWLESVPLTVKVIGGLFLLSFASISAAYFIGVVQKRKQKTLVDSSLTEAQKSTQSSTHKFAQGYGTVDNSPETINATLNTKFESEKAALQSKHESEMQRLRLDYETKIRGYERGYDELKRKHDLLENQNKGLNAQLVSQTWLYNVAGKQAEEIDRFVILDRIERGDVRLHDLDGWPFIRFHFYILNKSVYNVAVELDNNAKDSYILFKYEGLRSERFMGIPNNELYIPHYTEGCLTIEQRLSPTEAHTIARSAGQDDAVFHFDRLVITIRGRNQEPRIDEKRLVIDKTIPLTTA